MHYIISMNGEWFRSRAYLRFLSTDSSLVPVSAGAEVFLLCSHDLLKGTDMWAMGRSKKHFKKKFCTSLEKNYIKYWEIQFLLSRSKKLTSGFSSQGRCVFK